jgi:hypothetical protein
LALTITRVCVATLLAAALLGLRGAPPALAATPSSSTGLHVIPFPRTPDASVDSRIIFSSLKPSQITSVTVTGSGSGVHPGRKVALPDGAGAAFVPATPFSPGEQVTVRATLNSPQAGTASGAPGATALDFSFTVAVQTGRGGPPPPAGGTGPTQSFLSEPDLKPPVLTATSDSDTGSGDIMLSPYHSLQAGPMILGPAGQLVWFDPLPGWTANLEVQRYHGQPVLTYWHESSTGAIDEVVLNRNYQTVSVLHAADDYRADVHEFQLTPQGTALIDAVVPVKANLSAVGGSSSGVVADCVVQELDVKTGQLLWEWHMLGHVPLTASYERPSSSPTSPWGFCHLNSIQQLPDGNLLVSARHTWGVYEIDKQTGRVIWTVGGKYSSFKLGPGVTFAWQHDAHLQGNVLTLFNDDWNGQRGSPRQGQSSAEEISLNTSAMTATLLHIYDHAPPLVSASQGSAQLLRNGNMFVGWGSQPDFSEYTSAGQQIFNGAFSLGVSSYRAYRFPWQGQPTTRPSVGLLPGPNGTVKVYSSWNGATQVRAWRIMGGGGPHSQGEMAQGRRTGFETARSLSSEPPYFSVQALDSHGHVLGTSAAAADPGHVALFGPTAFVRASLGTGAVPVLCLTGHTCRLTLQISSGATVLATHTAHPVPSGRGTLIDFKLSAAGIGQLTRAPGHRLPVQVSLRDSSGASATVNMDLIPYSISGARVHRQVSQGNGLQIVQDTGFVSATGTGHIIAACYSSVPCSVQASVFAHDVQIAHTAPRYLGADEMGFLTFKLNSAGELELRDMSSNQLPARITLSSGHARATGHIALVRYR